VLVAFEARSGALTLRAFSQENALLIRPIHVFGLVVIAASCAREQQVRPPAADDFGDAIVVKARPQRIVSLNPATTDLVFALGAGDRLVGRTHWDLYPDAAKAVPDLGSGIRPNVEAVLGARPDLVLLYASNDNRAAAAAFRTAGVNTLSLKIDHIADFERAARLVGKLVGDSARGVMVADSVRRTLDRVRSATLSLEKPTVFWHIWDAPLITIARGSYMDELVSIAGGKNIYADLADASPMVSIEDVLSRDPDFIITGPEGARKIRADARWSEAPAVKGNRILVADTMLVGRPSVRLGEAAVSLARLLHPEKKF
jgi:ABC-type Fe3+-hydroxamate transport system substrate-binding protein